MFRFALGSLRLRLILLVFLAVIPSLGQILLSDNQNRGHIKAMIQEDTLRLVRIVTVEQEQLFIAAKQFLITLAQLPGVRDGNVENCQALFSDLLAQYPFYTGITLVNPDGNVTCSVPPAAPSVSFADRSWFQQVLQARDFVIGEYLVGRISGKSVIVLAYPILDTADHLQSIVALGIDLAWINNLLSKADLPPESIYTVIDKNYTVLARYPDPEMWVGKSVLDLPIRGHILSKQGEGTIEAEGIDGIQRLYAYAPLIGDLSPSAYVFIGIPKTIAYAAVDKTLRTNLAILAMAMTLALTAAWYGGNLFILGHIRALVHATKRLESGDLSARTGLSAGVGELSQLSQSFDQMAETLQAHTAEIEQANRVLSKTNRALVVISACNQALIRAAEEEALLNEICNLIVNIGGYRLAWVGFAEYDEEKTVRPVAQAGYDEGYVDSIGLFWADTEIGRGPTGTAIRTGKTVVAKNILTEPNLTWRTEASERGYTSLIALPLIANTRILGALNIFSEEVDTFDPEEVKLLEEMAGDLAFGIATLRARIQHQQAEEKIETQLRNLAALRNIDMAITSSLDLRVTLNVLLAQVTDTLGVDAACILLNNSATQVLEFSAGRGFRTQALKYTSLHMGEGHAGRAALERRIVSIPNLEQEENGLRRSHLLASEEFVTYFAIPLIVKGNVKGVLEIFHRTHLEPDQEWLDFLEALSLQAAIAIDNAALLDNLQHSNDELMRAYDHTLEGWSRALDMRDKETEGHSKRVTNLTLRLANKLGVNESDLVHIRRGAMLHDIGKMGVPDSILFKPDSLTDEEWKIMRRHPTLAYEMLSPIAYLLPALDIPYCHHEKWDGSGYPRGLKEEQIPLAARIFALVDVWDALRSNRPYRPAWTDEAAKAYIKDQSGKHFDPQVVDVFLRIVEDDHETNQVS